MLNIYLVGMMGSGKSVTGKVYAELAGKAFVDLDREIEKKNQKTISEIFRDEGESFFREQEALVLKEFSENSNQVISTGGGIIKDVENVEVMKDSGIVIYLESSPEVLWERVQKDPERPLLQTEDPKQSLQTLLSERETLYIKAADHTVETDGKTAQDVAIEMKNVLREAV